MSCSCRAVLNRALPDVRLEVDAHRGGKQGGGGGGDSRLLGVSGGAVPLRARCSAPSAPPRRVYNRSSSSSCSGCTAAWSAGHRTRDRSRAVSCPNMSAGTLLCFCCKKCSEVKNSMHGASMTVIICRLRSPPFCLFALFLFCLSAYPASVPLCLGLCL